MIPEFMKKYYDGSDNEGKEEIRRLAREYEEERRTFFETTFNEKQAFQRDWNRLTGDNKVLTHDEAVAPINYKYKEKAKTIATAHGYKEQQVQVQQPVQPAVQTPKPSKAENPKRKQFLKDLKAMRDSQKQVNRLRH